MNWWSSFNWRVPLILVFLNIPCFGQAGDNALSLVQRYLRNLNEIQSLEYSGILEGWVSNTSEGIVRKHFRIFKAIPDCRFLEIHHLGLDAPLGLDKNHETTCFIPNRLQVYNHLNRTMEVSTTYSSVEKNSKLEYSAFDFYITAIGWLPESSDWTDSMIRKNKWPTALLKNSALKPMGCVTVQSNQDECTEFLLSDEYFSVRFWLSDRLGGMPVQIEQTLSKNADFDFVRFEFSNYQLIKGVYLPMRVSRKVFKNREERPVASADLNLEDLRVNSLEKKDFEITVGEGCLSMHFESKRHFASPGGLDLLDTTVAYGKGLITDKTDTQKGYAKHLYVTSGLLFLLFGAGLWIKN